jgi:hypothetical protein
VHREAGSGDSDGVEGHQLVLIAVRILATRSSAARAAN